MSEATHLADWYADRGLNLRWVQDTRDDLERIKIAREAARRAPTLT